MKFSHEDLYRGGYKSITATIPEIILSKIILSKLLFFTEAVPVCFKEA